MSFFITRSLIKANATICTGVPDSGGRHYVALVQEGEFLILVAVRIKDDATLPVKLLLKRATPDTLAKLGLKMENGDDLTFGKLKVIRGLTSTSEVVVEKPTLTSPGLSLVQRLDLTDPTVDAPAAA